MNKSITLLTLACFVITPLLMLVIVCIHLGANGDPLSEYSMDVVAMGTGSKCIGGSKMSNQGNKLSRSLEGSTQGNTSDS